MSQTANQGNEAGSSGFFRSITALASSETDDQQTQDSTSVEESEPANEENQEEFSNEETGEETEEQVDPESEVDPDDPEKKRFKYWQSQHDKAKAELSKAKADLEAYKGIPQEAVDIAKGLIADPKALEILDQYYKTGQNPIAQKSSGPSAKEQLKALQRPTEPVKPDNFDEDEAITDPRSESAKYLRDERKYEKELQNFLLKREELRDKAEEEAEQTRAVIERQRAEEQRVRKELQTKHGLAATEVQEFEQMFSSNPTLDDLVLFYKAKKGLLKQAAQVTQKKQELDKKAELAKKNPPAPGTKTGGSAGQPKTGFFK